MHAFISPRGTGPHLFVILLSLGLALLAGWPASAQQEPDQFEAAPEEWELADLGGSVFQLFTPTTGALFARVLTNDQRWRLMRSDDAGLTWRAVDLPPQPPEPQRLELSVAVDPTNHQVVYASGAKGLYKSTDDAASWKLILPDAPERLTAYQVAVSPADPNLVFVAAIPYLDEQPW
jgi:hypothetical protein